MKLTTIFLALTLSSTLALAQQDEVPKGIADSIGGSLRWTEGQFLTAAEAMPEAKYSFIPSAGEFKGVRSFAEQVKHVACANFAFFNEIEGKTPPPGCEKGGPAPAKTKAELVKYLQDSFDYGLAYSPPSTRRTHWHASRIRTPDPTLASASQSRRSGTSQITTDRSWNIF